MMKSKFELPEAIFNVTKSFPIKAEKPLQKASNTLKNASTDNTSVKTTFANQKILETAKWAVPMVMIAIITIMAY